MSNEQIIALLKSLHFHKAGALLTEKEMVRCARIIRITGETDPRAVLVLANIPLFY